MQKQVDNINSSWFVASKKLYNDNYILINQNLSSMYGEK